jgi:hypothetical protein
MRSRSIFLGLLLVSLAAFAQTDRGTITGTIADPAGAVVANAPVEVRNTATGALYQVASTETGNFTLAQLPAGVYSLSVTVPGFKNYIAQNVTVQVAVTTRLNVVLEVGATTESITVSDAAPLLKTESGEMSHNLSTERVNNLPVINLGFGAGIGNVRNPLQAINMVPGSLFANDNTLRVNGLPANTHSIRIEGQDATNGFHRQFNQGNQASLEAIQEVSVQVSNYAAEYGQASGGYFNYTMRSGSNQFHGGAYDYFVNEVLNAGTPFTAGTGSRSDEHLRNTQRRNDYGFLLGGPIWIPRLYDGHDRSFFFFNFEQFRESQTITTGLATVPTLAYRQGDFSAAQLGRLTIAGQPASDGLGNPLFQNAVYDPATERFAPDGSIVRLQYPGNRIPLTDMDPVAARIQNMIPLPRGSRATQLINNYEIPPYENYRHTTIPSFKIDHSFSTAIKMSGYFSETRTYSPNANGFDQPFTSSAPQDIVSRTVRVNYDHSLTPTMLLHLGAGILHTNQVLLTPDFDQSSLGWGGNFTYSRAFPYMAIGSNPAVGGFSYVAGQAFMYSYFKDIKPTFNTSLTWVKGNHTIKMGGEALFEGFPVNSYSRAHGNFTFGPSQSGNPWEDGRGLNSTTGLSYASFFLGRNGALQHSAGANGRLGNHAFGFFIQDTWKATRRLTIDYGLRYDYVTLLREQYGRMQSAAFNLPNPVAGNRNGTVIYEATCGCQFNRNYPAAWGPRLGVAYQITDKTVLRAGAGLMYGTAPNQANLGYSIGDFYSLSPPAYGEPSNLLRDGNPYAPGNRFGNEPIFWPDFRPSYPIEVGRGVRPPSSPFISIDRNSGRPPRIFQWSVGIQREVVKDLVVEAAYVGNRGVWFTAPTLFTYGYNALTPEGLLRDYGINTNVAADRTLLTTRVNSPAVLARFPNLAFSNAVYPGFPRALFLNQALRPYPQWLGIPPFLGPPMGVTWYDSLQAKVTKRVSHGLSLDAAFTWQKELALGVNSDTAYLTPAPTLINDVFNRRQNKQISSFSRPFMFVVSFRYTTPGFTSDSTAMKALSWAVRDWNFAGVLRYQSGQVLRVPASNNGFFRQLARTDNPANWGGANTYYNRVEGQPLLTVDPNAKNWDPTVVLALNPNAWVDAPAGTFGTAAPYYNNYRWQRQPQESLSLGRTFRLAKEGRVTFDIRGELFNVFNRLFLSSPAGVSAAGFPPPGPNPAQPTTCAGVAGVCTAANGLGTRPLTGGYGFVNTFNGLGSQPRTGQLVGRISF